MQVIVPMAGFGERFRRVGHTRPKPLIEVDGRPMIAWVLDLFPSVDDPICVCAREHLDEPSFGMEAAIRAVRPRARIVAVDAHREGPVRSLRAAVPSIDPARPVVVSVCDLNFPWDFEHFAGWFEQSGADGAVVVYRGFHPHLLHSTHYAFCREEGGRAREIREKHAFTADPIAHREPCSNGVYAWRSGAAFAASLDAVAARDDWRIDGEHYPSQCFQPMIEQGSDVVVYDTAHYLQWGNPRDLAAYERHAAAFAARVRPWPRPEPGPGTLIVPMAGLGQRFASAGYALPKPLVEVDGRPMATAAIADLPRREREVFVLRADLPGLGAIEDALSTAFPDATTVILDRPTDGQARSVALGLARADVDLDAPLVIGACDNGLRYDAFEHDARLARADVLVWVMRGHPGAVAHPRLYGWVSTDGEGEGDRVRGVSVKVPLGDPAHDAAIVGAFSFRRAGDYVTAFRRQLARDQRVHGELYVDSLIAEALALGLDVRVFEVDAYYGWGTPDDLRTHAYWQGFFDRWPHHPYRLEDDPSVAPDAIAALRRAASPELPAPLKPRAR